MAFLASLSLGLSWPKLVVKTIFFILGSFWPTCFETISNLFSRTLLAQVVCLEIISSLSLEFSWPKLLVLGQSLVYSPGLSRPRQAVCLETMSRSFLGLSWPKLSILKPSLIDPGSSWPKSSVLKPSLVYPWNLLGPNLAAS